MAITVKTSTELDHSYSRSGHAESVSYQAIIKGVVDNESPWLPWGLFRDGSVQLIGNGTIQVLATNEQAADADRDSKSTDCHPVQIGADITTTTVALQQLSFCARFVKIKVTAATGPVDVFLHGRN